MRVAECSIDMGAFEHVSIERSTYPDGGTDYIISFASAPLVPRLSVWRRLARFMLRETPLTPPGTVTLRNVSQELVAELVESLNGAPS
jgi:hypothetical protein